VKGQRYQHFRILSILVFRSTLCGLSSCEYAPGTGAATNIIARLIATCLYILTGMARETVGLNYGALRKECLDAVRQWPGCETVGGVQIIRDNTPGGFSVRVTLYGKADKKIADRAINYVRREKRRHFHLND
jgi:hypothetical protein